MVTDKSIENRVRKVAERRGFRLEKSRRRDQHATDYGKYLLVDAATNTVVSIGGGWLTLAQVEQQLEVLAAVQDPAAVRLIRAVAQLAMALTPLAGLDHRTMARLAGPVTAAAGLLGFEGTLQELVPAVGAILAAGPVAPPDVMTVGPLLDELSAAFTAFERAQDPLGRPLTPISLGFTRPLNRH